MSWLARCTAILLCLVASLVPCAAAQPGDSDASIVAAAQQQQWEQVTRLLSERVDVQQQAADGMTALHWATLWGENAIAEKLIDAGADVTAATIYQVTPLEIAAVHGRSQIAEMLLQRGSDARARTISSETMLMQAARSGDVPTVELLLQYGADPDAADQRQQTPLMWAAAEGHADVVAALLRSGSQRDTTLPSGFSALGFAARQGHLDVVECLLGAGADVDAAMQPKNTSGRAPRRGMSPLMLAVESGHFHVAIHLVQRGADPNDQRSGFAPLHALSWVRKPNRGDGVDGDPPPRGSGPLSSLEFVRQLVRHGADVNLPLEKGSGGNARLNMRGATPVLLAAFTADLPLLKLLVELGGDIHQSNVDGCTPLMAAAGVGVFVAGEYAGSEAEVLATLKYLHRQGASLDTVDDNGETAMHGAAYRSFPEVVRLLSRLGDDPRVWQQPNRHGATPLQIAAGQRPGSFKPDPATAEAIRESRTAK